MMRDNEDSKVCIYLDTLKFSYENQQELIGTSCYVVFLIVCCHSNGILLEQFIVLYVLEISRNDQIFITSMKIVFIRPLL